MGRKRGSTRIVFLSCLVLVAATATGQTVLEAGTIVFAEWATNAWYHGKVESTCEDGYQILYDDGDRKCCAPEAVVVDRVPTADEVSVGARVLAQWGTGRFYPGAIASVSDAGYAVNYDDGDRATVRLDQIRLRAPVASATAGDESSTESTGTVERDIDVWKGGSVWAEIVTDGRLWIDGWREGEITSGGSVYRDGSKVGEVEPNGKIWIGGSREGEVESNGRLWRGGSRVGSIESDGTIYLDGSIWGEADPFGGTYQEIRVVAAILAFFAPEFGFVE